MPFMARLTITLPDERHLQLRVRAAAQGKSISQLIEETLTAFEDAALNEAGAMLEAAWARNAAQPDLPEDEAMALVNAEVRKTRQEMARERDAARHR
jgi:plasmid stability protein